VTSAAALASGADLTSQRILRRHAPRHSATAPAAPLATASGAPCRASQRPHADGTSIVQLLADLSDLRKALHVKKVPHYSTPCYAEKRLLEGGLSSRSLELFSPELETAA